MEQPPSPTALQRDIGTRVRASRVAAGLTLRRLAGELGVSAATLSAVETGRTGLTAVRLAEVAFVLGVPVGSLLVQPERSIGRPAGDAGADHPPAAGDWRRYGPLELEPALAGALAAFVERGYAGATMRDVGRHAGLSVPGLYHHHASKHDLLVALLDLGVRELLARSTAARAEGRDPVERFTLLVECLVLFHTHRREIGFLGASEVRSLQPSARAGLTAARRTQQHLVDVEVVRGARAGVFRTDVPRQAARAVVTMCTALPQWWVPGGPASPERVAADYVVFALDVVGHTDRTG
jgi:AcrR family transcriptional regulator/DNA-binding XRE family transcriptional regulator